VLFQPSACRGYTDGGRRHTSTPSAHDRFPVKENAAAASRACEKRTGKAVSIVTWPTYRYTAPYASHELQGSKGHAGAGPVISFRTSAGVCPTLAICVSDRTVTRTEWRRERRHSWPSCMQTNTITTFPCANSSFCSYCNRNSIVFLFSILKVAFGGIPKT
jgi:hypothetical protein